MMTVCFTLLMFCILTIAMARIVKEPNSDSKDSITVTLKLDRSIESYNLDEEHELSFDCIERLNHEIRRRSNVDNENEKNHNPITRIRLGSEGLALLQSVKNTTGYFACSAVKTRKQIEINHDHFRMKRNVNAKSSQVRDASSSLHHRLLLSRQRRDEADCRRCLDDNCMSCPQFRQKMCDQMNTNEIPGC